MSHTLLTFTSIARECLRQLSNGLADGALLLAAYGYGQVSYGRCEESEATLGNRVFVPIKEENLSLSMDEFSNLILDPALRLAHEIRRDGYRDMARLEPLPVTPAYGNIRDPGSNVCLRWNVMPNNTAMIFQTKGRA